MVEREREGQLVLSGTFVYFRVGRWACQKKLGKKTACYPLMGRLGGNRHLRCAHMGPTKTETMNMVYGGIHCIHCCPVTPCVFNPQKIVWFEMSLYQVHLTNSSEAHSQSLENCQNVKFVSICHSNLGKNIINSPYFFMAYDILWYFLMEYCGFETSPKCCPIYSLNIPSGKLAVCSWKWPVSSFDIPF